MYRVHQVIAEDSKKGEVIVLASVTFNKVVKFGSKKDLREAIKTVLPQSGSEYDKSVASARKFLRVNSFKQVDVNRESKQ